jgi:type II secretion system protein I
MLYRPGAPTPRAGLSLLEVLVSLAIFLLALVALGEIVSFASDRALDVQHRSEALQICQSRLAEVQAGSIPLQSVDLAPCEEEGFQDYQWALDIEAGAVTGLYNVTVRVVRERPNHSQMEVALSQMVIDPTTLGSTQDMPGSQSSTDLSSSSSSSSTTGSTSSGTTGSTTTGGK